MATFGNTGTGTNTSQDGGNYVRGTKFTLSEDAVVSSMSIRGALNAAGTANVRLLIYDDDGSGANPGTLIGSTDPISVNSTTEQWWSANLSVSISAGNYWLMWQSDGGQTFDYKHDVSAGAETYISDTYSDGPANPANSVTGTFDNSVSIYATYTAGSPSASVSPSSSASPSLSPSVSASASASRSASRSQSPSASASRSLSPSSSGSASASRSASASASASPSAGYTGYTRGNYAALPSNDDDLETAYSAQDITDVATDNGVRVGQVATGEYMVHQFKNFMGSNNSCTLTWNGQSSLAPSSSQVVLQIYNRNTTSWDTVDSDNATAANTDFDLIASVSDLTNYKDARNVISSRVYQQAT